MTPCNDFVGNFTCDECGCSPEDHGMQFAYMVFVNMTQEMKSVKMFHSFEDAQECFNDAIANHDQQEIISVQFAVVQKEHVFNSSEPKEKKRFYR